MRNSLFFATWSCFFIFSANDSENEVKYYKEDSYVTDIFFFVTLFVIYVFSQFHFFTSEMIALFDSIIIIFF